MGLEGTSILLVDDDEDTLEILTFLLVEQGATVHSANNGTHALEKLGTWTPEVILLDIAMPGIDGSSSLRPSRRSTASQNIPIVALTAHALAEDRHRCIDAWFTVHVSKPYHVDALLGLLALLSKKSRSG
jgi:two-component system sensor histidine kinase/response regulator